MTDQTLIATVGSEPQVVTLVLDLLFDKGYPITKVMVVHTCGKDVRDALKALSVEMGALQPISFEKIGVIHEHRPVTDNLTHEDAGAFLRTIYQVVLKEKRAGRVVHLSIAGGRKTMAVYGMVAAQSQNQPGACTSAFAALKASRLTCSFEQRR